MITTPKISPPDGGAPLVIEDLGGKADNLRGIAWMLSSVVMASAMSIAVRELAVGFDSRMIVMLRASIVGAFLILPIIMFSSLRKRLRFSRPWMHILRGSLIGVSTHLGFYTLTQIPMATATVLFFTAPIFATILSIFVHKEKVGIRRILAVCAGFVGAVIVLRPGFGGFHPAMLTALSSSMLFAIALTLSRNLAKADGAFSTFLSSVLITVVITAPLAAPVFEVPSTPYLWFLTAILVITSAGRNVADIQAYRYGEASILAPIAYLRLVLLGFAGFVMWAEVPDTPTIIGAAVIIFATLYIAQREAKLRKLKR